MKLCDTCIYRNNVEQLKPCIIYRDDCEYYEKERGDMTREEAIHKMEYSKRAYQMLIDEKVQEGVLVGQGINAEWSADTPIIDAYKDMLEACDMAIKALEQEPCGDCVSRQALQDWIKDKTFGDIVVASEHNFDCLPPVTPQRKIGHWIPVSERLPERVEWYLTSIKWDDGTERVITSWFDGVSFKAEVIAWMPLPEPYKPY